MIKSYPLDLKNACFKQERKITVFDYSQMTSRTFEKLAKKYLEQKYPDYTWNLTPPSGDGNKDILCTFRVLDQECEYWAEAKFTKSQTPHTLLKGQLDPTLVSALLTPKQVSICFISNNEITETYYYRLNDFRMKTNIGIELVLKDEFEEWLINNPQLLKNNNIQVLKVEEEQKHVNLGILSATITDMQNSNQYKTENILLNDTIYYLYVIIESEKKCDHISLTVNSEFALPFRSKLLVNPEDFCVKKGKQVYKFELIPQSVGKTELNIQISDDHDNVAQYSISKLVVTPNSNISLSYIQQEKSLLEISRYINESNDHNFLIPVIGNGATGKTKLLQDLFCELNPLENMVSISFVGNDFLDAKALIKILIFFNMGNIFEYSKEDIISQFDIIQNVEAKVYYQKLIRGFFEVPEICVKELERKLKDNKICLLYPSQSKVKQTLLLDDLHKIQKELYLLLKEFTRQFLQQKNNQTIIFASRQCYNDFSLDFNTLCTDWIKTYFLDGLSKEDKLTTISQYFSLNEDIQFDRTTDDLIVFSNILSSKISGKNVDNTNSDSISKTVELVHSFEKPDIINLFQYKERLNQLKKYNKIIELIYLINWGIDYSKICKFFVYNDIEFLLEQKIIKRIGKKLYPYHDYYVKSYFEDHGISDSTVEIVKKICDTDYENKYIYLSSLLKGGYHIYCQIEGDVRSLENYYFIHTDYYKAYTLSKSLELYINKNERLSIEELHDLLILAVSSGYFEKPGRVRERYKQLIKFCKPMSENHEIQGMVLRANSEIINIDYWELNSYDLIDKIQITIKNIPIIQQDSGEDLVCGYLNLLNRKMVVALLKDNFELSEQIFEENILEINRLNRKEYLGYLYMDFAKGIYNQDPIKALKYMENAQEIFRTLNTEYRRLLDCNCEVEYLKCLVSDSINFSALEQAASTLRNEQYYELYSKAKLKLAALKLSRGQKIYSKSDIEQDIYMSEYVLDYTATGRLLLFQTMIKNAFRIFCDEPFNKIKLTNAEKRLLDNMGMDFQNIWKLNENGIKKFVQLGAKYISSNSYIIDSRIW